MSRAGFPLVACAVLLLLGAPSLASVDDQERERRRGISDRVNVSLGGFLVRFDTKARLDSEELDEGSDINLEDDLGLEKDRTDVRMDGYWRFARKQRVEWSYILLSRSKSRRLDRTLEFGDETFQVGAFTESDFKTQIIKLAYKYSFVNNGRVDAGLSVGLSTFLADLSLEAGGRVSGGGGSAGASGQVEASDTIFPVPMLGAHAEVTILPRFFFRTSGEIFDLSYDDYDAQLLDLRATFDYYPWDHVGFGLGYNVVSLEMIKDARLRFEVDYQYSGLMAYVNLTF